MDRPPTANEALCQRYRQLLTHGFYVIDEDGVVLEGETLALILEATKPWRNELWKLFRTLEDRLCPVKAFEEGRA